MAISPDKLKQIISAQSKGLCSPEANRRMDEMAGRQAGNLSQKQLESGQKYVDIGKPDYNYDDGWGDGGYEFSEQQMSYQPKKANQNIQNYTNEQVKKSGLPDAVKKSLINEKIMMKDNVTVAGQLGLDDLIEERKQQISINKDRQTPQQHSSIDYDTIKSIFKECLEEYFNENETLKTIKLSGGNIKLVDNSGNIYAAKLERKGNINDKK